jgi:uncharacterized protein YjdB
MRIPFGFQAACVAALALSLVACGGWSHERDHETRVSGVPLNKTSLSLAVGSKESLTATVQPTNAANTKVTWQSSNPDVASVDGNGTVKAHRPGHATVTVTTQDCGDSSHSSDHHSDGHGSHSGGGHHSDGHADNCNGGRTHHATVDVYAPVPAADVTLDKTELSLEIGASQTLTATVLPPSATVTTVAWKSSDESVAIVSNGVVTATGAGIATITVTTDDGGFTATCVVTVMQ